MPTPSGYSGRFAKVLIEDAIIGPGKEDLSPWDPGREIPPQVFVDLTAALGGADPLSASLAVLASPLLNQGIVAAQKPDVYGTIRLDVLGELGDDYWLASREQRTEDSFTPAFPSRTGFANVPIDADVRLTVRLADADFLNMDDVVGVVVINGSDIRTAYATQRKYLVPAASQTGNQVLFIGISVLE
jgi:hypothetical protein